MNDSLEQVKERCAALGIKPASRVLVVSLARQLLMFFDGAELQKTYVVSTSTRPPSNAEDSLGTPRGLHAIAEKIGAGTPPGIVFKSRVCTGRHFNEFSDEENAANLVTTRILWLRGLEPGHNAGGHVDTYERYIYLHGTNHEDRLGAPASAGCVLLRNLDVLELFEQVRVGDLVWIAD